MEFFQEIESHIHKGRIDSNFSSGEIVTPWINYSTYQIGYHLIGTGFPHLDLGKALVTFYKFVFEDCSRNQKKFGISAYNKIKHGLLVVLNASEYIF